MYEKPVFLIEVYGMDRSAYDTGNEVHGKIFNTRAKAREALKEAGWSYRANGEWSLDKMGDFKFAVIRTIVTNNDGTTKVFKRYRPNGAV